jgi:hypothetical protein
VFVDVSFANSTIVIPNMNVADGPHSVQLKAAYVDNSGAIAWSILSNSNVSGYPYIVPTTPPQISVDSSLNSLVVRFVAPSGGYPTPSNYYYSVDGDAYVPANTTESPITIGGFSVPGSHTVILKAVYDTSAGVNIWNSFSASYPEAQPYIQPDAPAISGVDSSLNALISGSNEILLCS